MESMLPQMVILLFALFTELVDTVNYTICNNTIDVVRMDMWQEGWVTAPIVHTQLLNPLHNATQDAKVKSSSSSKVKPTTTEIPNCKLPLAGCDACRFNITISYLRFPVCRNVNDGTSINSTPSASREPAPSGLPTCIPGCSHLVIYEPAYADVTTHFLFSQESSSSTSMTSYTSLSSSVVIMLCISDDATPLYKVKLQYKVIEKRTHFVGGYDDPNSRQGLLKSPNFPRGYAIRGEIYTYVIETTDPGGGGGGIRVVFDDWDLAPYSRVMFYTNISSHSPIGTFFGSGPRPLLYVPGRILCMTFEPDVGLTTRTNNMGFQATYTFLSEGVSSSSSDSKESLQSAGSSSNSALTDCGVYYRYVAGGNITFHRAQQGSTATAAAQVAWDCLWVVTPHSAFDWVLLRLVNLSLTENVVLTVRSGVTSDCPLVANISATGNGTFPMTTQYEGRDGFYIRLQGFVSGTDLMSVVFAAFNRVQASGCAHAGEFECLSGHCIDSHLACDGHLHCDDGHDEGTACKLSPAEQSMVQVICKVSEFPCANGRRCLPLSAVCDTWLDCQDGSDEYKCPSHASPSPMSVDGTSDGSNTVQCEDGTQPCHHGRQCVSVSGLCDGKYDCWDRSDEMHCALSFETSMSGPAPWRLVMPLGIALCVLLSLCVLALCIRTFIKQDATAAQTECNGSSRSSASSGQQRCNHRGGSGSRRPHSVTSETPLTLDLSRSTSGVTVESTMPDSPPSYEEAMRRSPEGANESSPLPETGGSQHQLSPSVLSPPAYHIPITGKQHFSFSLWPLSSSPANSTDNPPNHSRQLEEANVQLLASEFNSSSGTSELGSSVGLNSLASDDVGMPVPSVSHQNGVLPGGSFVIEVERADSEMTDDTLSIGTVTTCSSVTVRDCDTHLSYSLRELSPDGSNLSQKYHTPSANSSRRSSQSDRVIENGVTGNSHHHHNHKKACHCHCKGHDSRRTGHKRTRSRPGTCEKGPSSRIRQRSVCACSLTDVQLNEICVKNRNAKESSSSVCDSRENESLLMSDADSPLLCDVDDDDLTSCDERGGYMADVPSILESDVQCLVHENAFCDTVC